MSIELTKSPATGGDVVMLSTRLSLADIMLATSLFLSGRIGTEKQRMMVAMDLRENHGVRVVFNSCVPDRKHIKGFMVSAVGKAAPTVVQPDADKAWAEAERIARVNGGGTVHVLALIGSVTAKVIPAQVDIVKS